MVSMLKNRLYRFNRWLDRNGLFKFVFMISYIAVAMLNLTTGSLTAFVLMMLIVCAFAVYRMFIMDNRVTFYRSHYDVPEVGEIVIVKKDFYYDGSFRKFINTSDQSQKPNWWKVTKGTELIILNVEETSGDWKIRFIEPTINSKTRGDLHLYYLDTKDYWDTKANIRSKILSKIGI